MSNLSEYQKLGFRPGVGTVLNLSGATSSFLDSVEPYGESSGVQVDVEFALTTMDEPVDEESDPSLWLFWKVLLKAQEDGFETVVFTD